MAKRKRTDATNGSNAKVLSAKKTKSSNEPATVDTSSPSALVETNSPVASSTTTIQIVAGSYDRVLHGITVTIDPTDEVEFADTFLFNAHTSALRCLAVSPPSVPIPGQTQKVFLASGGTDERINVYHLSAHPPSLSNKDAQLLAKVGPRPILENPKNRELGTLLHHSSTITALSFPTRSKLLSASEDSTIGVTRTRDWSLLSTIKTPIPKAQGRPSGDTAPFGTTPSGVNDFAIDPSIKVMISVSKGERCMRLWNLITGKKAGVLNFERDMLSEVGEGKHATGEGRRVVWGTSTDSDEFSVAFDRDVVVFDMSARPKCRLMGNIRTKVHQLRYVTVGEKDAPTSLLAVSTEDGRILFFSTETGDLDQAVPKKDHGKARNEAALLPIATLVAELGGKEDGVSGRIKDFVLIEANAGGDARQLFATGGSSDGRIRIWKLSLKELTPASPSTKEPRRAGKLLGTYETQNRITCLTAFSMIPRPEGVEDSEDEADEDESGSESDEAESE